MICVSEGQKASEHRSPPRTAADSDRLWGFIRESLPRSKQHISGQRPVCELSAWLYHREISVFMETLFDAVMSPVWRAVIVQRDSTLRGKRWIERF